MIAEITEPAEAPVLSPELTGEIERQRDAFVERIFQSLGGAFDIFTIYLGDRLGLYEALAEDGPATSVGLARRTGTTERYVREWLEQQTVTGILSVEDPNAGPKERVYRLPEAFQEVLVDRDSLNYVAPLARLVVGAVHPIHKLLEAFRTGGGVPFAEYGRDLMEGQADINRPAFLQQLGSEWIPAMPDVDARLRSPGARIADIGCGAAWSSIGMAKAYPGARVDGFDLDEASVDLGQANVREAGLEDRVRVLQRDAGDPALAGRYDLVTAFECVHDMSDPVGVLRSMRRLAGEDGAVLVVDERVGERFTTEGNDVDWMMYGWSILHCLPVGMAENPSVGTGTVMRPDVLSGFAREAGFREVEILPIDNYFFRFYRLHV